jgi:hypothetical protein
MCAMLYSMTTKTRKPVRLPLSEADQAVHMRVNFDSNGTLSARSSHDCIHDGRLPIEYAPAFRAAQKAADFYVVYSYVTPIAWFANGVWFMPDAKYSPTTSRHQSTVKKGINA